jgi:hypothetical protein
LTIVIAATLWLALAAPEPASPGPTLAREDTLYTELPEELVSAPRVTLDEILDRVARGEARRESLLVDQSFTATFRLVRNVDGRGEPQLLSETVARVYKKRPDRVRMVVLRRWKKEHSGDVRVEFRPDMGEEIVNFAFRPEARRDFSYRILGRDLVGDHVIYRLAFEPRSPLDPTQPSGLVWVDTNDFVIVRQEVSFKRSPAPLFIRDVDRMVIERRREEGHWVLWRVLVRVKASLPLPMVGRSFDFSLQLDQYAINHGLADSLFVGGSGSR